MLSRWEVLAPACCVPSAWDERKHRQLPRRPAPAVAAVRVTGAHVLDAMARIPIVKWSRIWSAPSIHALADVHEGGLSMTGTRNMERLVLVTGATGKQGGAVARHLMEHGFRVRALTRDPDKPAARSLAAHGAEVVRGDLDDIHSVEPALRGAYGVFSVQNFWEVGYEREVREGIALADAAKTAGVEHFVYSSVGSAHRHTGLSHFESKWEVEEHIRAIGIPATVLRPVFFMDNWETPALRGAILGGTLAQPLSPDRTFQQIAVSDIGAFATMVFERRDEWLGRAIDLASDERSMADIAQTFGRVIGRPVRYVQVPWEQFRQVAGEEYERMYRWFADVGYDVDLAALRQVAPQMTTFEQYLRSHDWENARAPAPA